MGNLYVNYTLRGVNQEDVASQLSGRSALVTPVASGCVVVFDEESDSQDATVIAELGAKLSGNLKCAVLAILNHDDDILFYQLFESGSRVDEYCSAPGYFSGEETPPSGGDGRKLCRAFGSTNVEEVEAILHREEELPTFAVEQHGALVDALGISPYAVGSGYMYVSAGELPEGLEESDLSRPN